MKEKSEVGGTDEEIRELSEGLWNSALANVHNQLDSVNTESSIILFTFTRSHKNALASKAEQASLNRTTLFLVKIHF